MRASIAKNLPSTLRRNRSQHTGGSAPAEGLYAKLAAISQVLMLVLVGFGYWYTVLPVYQKSLLDEQIAKATLDLEKKSGELDAKNAELANVMKTVDASQRELDGLRGKIYSYQAEAEVERSKAMRAELNAQKVQVYADVKYGQLRRQSISLFLGELFRCSGKKFIDYSDFSACLDATAKKSESFSQLDSSDRASVLRVLRQSSSKHKDDWDALKVGYDASVVRLDSEIQELKVKVDTLKANGVKSWDSELMEMELAYRKKGTDKIMLDFRLADDQRKMIGKIIEGTY